MPIVAIGEIVVDWLSVDPGKDLFSARNFHRALGGNSANVAVGLTRLGTPVRFVAKTGADVHAQYLRAEMEREGVDSSNVLADERYPTAQCYMTTSADGEHHYRNWPRPHAADMLTPAEVSEDLFEGVKFLHATGISFVVSPRRDAVQRAIDIARERNIPVSFDALFPTGWDDDAHRYVEPALHQADLIKMNEFELGFWSGKPVASLDVNEIAAHVFEKYSPRALFVTCAEKGSLVVTADGIAECPPVEVDCVSGVGAGDSYVAGILHYLYGRDVRALTLEDWLQAGMTGNFVGALSTRATDANSAIPTRAELDAWLAT